MVADAGLRITSASGTTQVTNDAVTFGQSSYGALTLTDDGLAHPSPQVRGTMTVGGVNPMVAIRTPNIPVSFVRGGSGGQQFAYIAESSIPVTIDYWVFDTASSAIKDNTMSGAGCRVYTPDGVLTFDAAMPVNRIIDKVSFALPEQTTGSDQVYETTVTYNVPGGSVYAVIPTSSAGLQTMWETGVYSSGSQPGSPTLPDDPNNPGPGFTFKRMRLESYLSTVRSISASQIEVGLTRIEVFEAWYPIGQEEAFVKFGSLNFLIVDVTNYPSSNSGGVAPTPDITPASVDWPNLSISTPEPVVGLSGATKTLTGFNQAITLRVTVSGITNSAENTALFCVKGGANVGSTGMAEGASFTFTANPGDAIYFYTECSTSSGSRSASFTVTVTNVSANYVMDTFTCSMVVDNDNNHNIPDTAPDTITGWTKIVAAVNEEQYEFSTANYPGSRTISGTNRPFTMRAQASGFYDATGNCDFLSVNVYTSPVGNLNWVHRGSFNGKNGWLDIPDMVSGQSVALNPVVRTTGGRCSILSQLSLVSLTGPSTTMFADSTHELTVDNDNNWFPADYVPDPIPTVANLLPNTPNDTAFGTPRDFRILGINQTITLRLLRVVTGGSGNVARKWLNVSLSNDGTNWTLLATLTADTQQFDFNVVNGQYVRLTIELSTSMGLATSQWNIAVYNLNASGAEIVFLTLNGTVDNDNNFNVPDYQPDVITNWPVLNVSSNEPDYSPTTTWYGEHNITGINQPITIRFERYNYSGDLDALYFDCFTLPPGAGAWIHHGYFDARGTAQACLDVANVVNGTRVAINPHAISNGGGKSATFDMVMWSLSSNSVFASSTGNRITVDADNFPDYVPDGFSLPTLTAGSNENYISVTSGQAAQTLTGINRTITLRLAMVSISGSMDGGRFRLVRYTPSIGWHEAGAINLSPGGGSISVQFLPGDLVYTDVVDIVTNAGRKDMSFVGQLFNDSAGGYLITQHAVYLTADADNNFYDIVTNGISLPAMTFSSDTGYGSYQTQFLVSGINTTVSLRVLVSGISSAMADGYFYLLNSGGGILWQHHYNDGDADHWFAANNGDQFTFYVDGVALSLRPSNCSFTVSLYNMTNGGQLLSQTTVSGSVRQTGGGGGPGDIDP